MFKLTSRNKDLLLAIFYIAFLTGMMLLVTHFLGEVHGLAATVIVLIGQIAFLISRVHALERELRISRESHEPSKKSEK